MGAQCGKEQHFKVECKIDGIWYDDDFVFPNRATALAFKSREESYGSGNLYRVVSTSNPVNLPAIDQKSDGDENGDGLSDEEGLSSLFDWPAFFDLSVLCPMATCCTGDGDLDRIYHQCYQGRGIVGQVFL